MSLPQERSTAGLVSYTWVARSRSGSSSFTASALNKERDVVYWYSFSNLCTMCIHCGFSLVGNNLNNTRSTP